ncbi:MAG TPA: hypothetical protein VMB85_14070 [Bryobacteraceae bacterium]|nr:hypothetical protein [Bryobacteraceae bacterium]
MNSSRFLRIAAAAAASLLVVTLVSEARTPDATVPVRMTVTLNLGEGKRMPEVKQEDVIVRQGKERLPVAEWVPATGNHAGLDLFILIDDASETRLGVQLNDLRNFINAQGPATAVGVGYMRNAGVTVVQDFTTDHAAAAKALRLPMASTGAYGSPYLSLISLLKRWPDDPNRREVIMVTDGIDRARRTFRAWGLEAISPDVDVASEVAQRTGTMVHSIYFPGIGRHHRNFWEMNMGQNGLSKLADETGGESFYLGIHPPVSFAPYLDQIQQILDNQYLLTFHAKPGKKSRLQSVTLATEVAGVEFGSADSVFVPVK